MQFMLISLHEHSVFFIMTHFFGLFQPWLHIKPDGVVINITQHKRKLSYIDQYGSLAHSAMIFYCTDCFSDLNVAC